MKLVALVLLLASTLAGQVCRLSVTGLNRNRRVFGPVNTECGPLHSAPFGNWGVTSNFGPSRDGHQFDGWCHDSSVTYNDGKPQNKCNTAWYQWNSCTSHTNYSAPNCTLYNSEECTVQESTTGVNVLAAQTVELPVSCPTDVDGDGIADTGGCSDLRSYAHGTNFMTIYELDPFTGNQLVQTLIFPETPVSLDCSPGSCPPTGSQWVKPIAYDDPKDRAVVDAEFAMAMNGGEFFDISNACGKPVSKVTAVSAASYQAGEAAPDALVSLFGEDLAPRSQIAISLPLPTMLAGTTVELFDSRGQHWPAPLLFVSATQINLLIPPQAQLGPARLRVSGSDGAAAEARLTLTNVAPALFTADASGRGPAAALAVYSDAGGKQRIELTFECDTQGCRDVALDPPAAITLFGAGFRGRSALGAVRAHVGGADAEVTYAGAPRRLRRAGPAQPDTAGGPPRRGRRPDRG
ncbi:MAG: hypothetical protein R2748_26665 [Bryobacterales bacterium]